MPDLIIMRYEQIHVDVIIFVSNYFFYTKLILPFVIYFIWMATDNYFWHGPHSSGVIREDAH
jgi:hypothetical protein